MTVSSRYAPEYQLSQASSVVRPRSKAGEGKLNLTALRSAESSYFGEFGTYIQMAQTPAGTASS